MSIMPAPQTDLAAPPAAPVTSTPVQDVSSTPVTPASSEAPNTKQLQEQYEQARKQLDSYSQLGKPEELQGLTARYQGWHNESVKLGRALGYSEESIQAAFADNPLETLSFLKQQFTQSQGAEQNLSDPRQLRSLVERVVNEQTRPVTEHINGQIAERGVATFNQTFDAAFDKAYPPDKHQGFPEVVKKLLKDATTEMMKYDPQALHRLKTEGRTADIERFFESARAMVMNALIAYSGWEAKRSGMPGPGNVVPGKKKFTLDDIIDDPSVIGAKYR